MFGNKVVNGEVELSVLYDKVVAGGIEVSDDKVVAEEIEVSDDKVVAGGIAVSELDDEVVTGRVELLNGSKGESKNSCSFSLNFLSFSFLLCRRLSLIFAMRMELLEIGP